MATALGHLGRLAMTQGDATLADAYLAETVELTRITGDTEHLTLGLCELASVRVASGALGSAQPLIGEAADATRPLNWWYRVRVLDVLAEWLFAAGRVEGAVVCVSAADRTRHQTEMNWDPDRVARRDTLIQRTTTAVPRRAFDTAWARGQASSLDEVLDLGLVAMSEAVVALEQTTPVARGRRELSPREFEVLALVADGWSDGEIAAELFITKKTASVHVAHIRQKLGVESRVGLAMAAIRLGLRKPPHDESRDHESVTV